MKNPEVFEKSDSLKSGNFYAVNAIQRCYRINEPDHFLKDMETSLVGYFDKKEQFHRCSRAVHVGLHDVSEAGHV